MKSAFNPGDFVKQCKSQNFYGYVTGVGHDISDVLHIHAYYFFYKDPKNPADEHFVWLNDIQPQRSFINALEIREDDIICTPDEVTIVVGANEMHRDMMFNEGNIAEICVPTNYGTKVWIYHVISGTRLGGPDILLCLTCDKKHDLIILTSNMVQTPSQVPVQENIFQDRINDLDDLIISIREVRDMFAEAGSYNVMYKDQMERMNKKLNIFRTRLKYTRDSYAEIKICETCEKPFVASSMRETRCPKHRLHEQN